MLNAAAEAAMLSGKYITSLCFISFVFVILSVGAQYASTAAIERVFSAQTNLRAPQEKRRATQAQVARAEAKVIEHSSKDSLENAWRQYKAQQKQEKEMLLESESKLDAVPVDAKHETAPDFPVEFEILDDTSTNKDKF